MGIRTVIFILAIFGIVWLIRRSLDQSRSSRNRRPAQVGQIVKCAHCGLHVPHGEAVYDASGTTFCSSKHRELGPGEDIE